MTSRKDPEASTHGRSQRRRNRIWQPTPERPPGRRLRTSVPGGPANRPGHRGRRTTRPAAGHAPHARAGIPWSSITDSLAASQVEFYNVATGQITASQIGILLDALAELRRVTAAAIGAREANQVRSRRRPHFCRHPAGSALSVTSFGFFRQHRPASRNLHYGLRRSTALSR